MINIIYIIFLSVFFLFLSSETNIFSLKFLNFSQNFSTSEFIIFLFVLFSLFNIKKEKFLYFIKNYFIFITILVIFLIFGFFSSIFTPYDKIYALKNYMRYILIILTSIFFVYINFYIFNNYNYIFILLILSFLLAIISIFEAYIYNFAVFLSNIFREGQMVFINNKVRPAATLVHSNVFACFMVISIFLSFKLFFENKINKILFFIFTTFFLIGLSLSSSRNALFTFLITLFLLFFNKIYRKYVIYILFLFIITYVIFSPSLKRISEIKTESSVSRILLWKASIKMFKDHPIFGVGPGCFNKLLKKYASDELLKLENIYIEKGALNAHNGFFNILSEFGFVGIFITILFFIFYLKTFIKLHPLKKIDHNYAILFSILLPFLPDAFFYSYFYMIILIILLFSLITDIQDYSNNK